MENGVKGISFKGTAEGLVVTIPEEMETDLIMDQIARKIKAAEKFFRGAKLKVIYRGKKLTEDEEKKLVDIMVENSGVTIEGIRHEVVPSPVEAEKPANISGIPIRRIFFKDLEVGPCKFVRGTVRSGTRILFQGNSGNRGCKSGKRNSSFGQRGGFRCAEGYGSCRSRRQQGCVCCSPETCPHPASYR